MSKTLTYRKARDDIFWHLYPECSDWPTENYVEITSEHAPFGGFCTDCLRLRLWDFENHWAAQIGGQPQATQKPLKLTD